MTLPAVSTHSDDDLPSTVRELQQALDQFHIAYTVRRQDVQARGKKAEAALVAVSDLLADAPAIDPQTARCLVASLVRVVQAQG